MMTLAGRSGYHHSMGLEPAHTKPEQTEGVSPPIAYIESNKKCLQCGYELRGLPIGGNCPECGQPTFIPTTIDDPLSLMPVMVIRKLKWGCWAAFWHMWLSFILVLLLWWSTMPKMVILSALLALAISWQLGVRLAIPALDLPQATILGFTSRSRMLISTRWLQIGWVIAAVGGELQVVVSTPSPLADFSIPIIRFGIMVGILGLVLLAIMLGRLAEWSRDDEAQKLLLWVMWLLIPAVWFFSMQPPLSRWSVLFYVASWLVVILYPVCLLKLARSVSYCVHHALESEGIKERQQEKRERFFSGVIDPYIDATSDNDHGE